MRAGSNYYCTNIVRTIESIPSVSYVPVLTKQQGKKPNSRSGRLQGRAVHAEKRMSFDSQWEHERSEPILMSP